MVVNFLSIWCDLGNVLYNKRNSFELAWIIRGKVIKKALEATRPLLCVYFECCEKKETEVIGS